VGEGASCKVGWAGVRLLSLRLRGDLVDGWFG
jgi:hypothetical protein